MGKAMRITRTVVLWVLSAFVALVMVTVGWAKLVGAAPWPEFFADFGYPTWFMFVVGVCQLGGGIALLIPRVSAYGAGLLTVVMAGAAITELTRPGGFPSPLIPFLYTVVLTGITVARYRQIVARGEAASRRGTDQSEAHV